MSVGYCTLYGDTNGGLGLLGDLYKTEVFELSRHINEYAGRELIPQAIIDKPPSAELAPGQKDEDNLPPYAVLDEILKWHIEGQHLSSKGICPRHRLCGSSCAPSRRPPRPLPACKSWCSAANTSGARPAHAASSPTRLWHRPANANCGTLRVSIHL
ncbi:NAD(+) synthase [Staphylococcus epidermidis]|nr:NAD(+) synthase [Staphylococcus epidermidis]